MRLQTILLVLILYLNIIYGSDDTYDDEDWSLVVAAAAGTPANFTACSNGYMPAGRGCGECCERHHTYSRLRILGLCSYTAMTLAAALDCNSCRLHRSSSGSGGFEFGAFCRPTFAAADHIVHLVHLAKLWCGFMCVEHLVAMCWL